RSCDRCNRHPAHLGTEPAPASSHSLCHSRGRAFTRSSSMGSSALSFLLTGKSPESCFSRQVPRRPETPPPQQEAAVRGSGSCDRGSTAIRKVSPPTASPRLGGLCQACLRRSHAGVALFRSLHHRVAVSNHRLLAFDHERVTFCWNDNAHATKHGKRCGASMMVIQIFTAADLSACMYFDSS